MPTCRETLLAWYMHFHFFPIAERDVTASFGHTFGFCSLIHNQNTAGITAWEDHTLCWTTCKDSQKTLRSFMDVSLRDSTRPVYRPKEIVDPLASNV